MLGLGTWCPKKRSRVLTHVLIASSGCAYSLNHWLHPTHTHTLAPTKTARRSPALCVATACSAEKRDVKPLVGRHTHTHLQRSLWYHPISPDMRTPNAPRSSTHTAPFPSASAPRPMHERERERARARARSIWPHLQAGAVCVCVCVRALARACHLWNKRALTHTHIPNAKRRCCVCVCVCARTARLDGGRVRTLFIHKTIGTRRSPLQ